MPGQTQGLDCIAQCDIFRGEGHISPASNGVSYFTAGQLWCVFSVYRLVFWVAVFGFFSFLFYILQSAIYTSTYPSLLKLPLLQKGGLPLALKPQPAGSLRATAGSYSSPGPQLLEKPKEENNNSNMHPIMCGFEKQKNDKHAFNPSLLQTMAAEKMTSLSFLKLHKQPCVFNRLGF